jgi:hypothetical protein
VEITYHKCHSRAGNGKDCQSPYTASHLRLEKIEPESSLAGAMMDNGLWLLSEVARTAHSVRRMLITAGPDEHCDRAAASRIVERAVCKPTAAAELQRIRDWLLAGPDTDRAATTR